MGASPTALRGFLEAAPDAIVVVDLGGRIAIVNHLTEEMFGYPRDQLLGQPVELLVPERYRVRHVREREQYGREPRTRPMGAGRELTGRRADGSEFPIEISLSPLRTERETLVISIIRDTTERRRAEEQIKASLREKEVLLKEIHHRVKNNLQVTSSLLKLQSAYIEDPRARALFQESQNRIRSMALVHEKLYQSRDLSRIDFGDYAGSLAGLLLRSFGMARRIELAVRAERVFLPIDSAVPCGLILNELLSNCLEHAFPDGRPGMVVIEVALATDGRHLLAVSDDGVGLPAGFTLDRLDSLGLQLVQTLVDQLHGTLELRRERGTSFRIRWPEARA